MAVNRDDVTVDDFGRACGQKNNSYTSIAQIMIGLSAFGVMRNHSFFNRSKLIDELDFGHPVIVLAHYGSIPKEYKQDQKFQGNHYYLVVGYESAGDDVWFYVHDPNWGGRNWSEGAYIKMPWEDVLAPAMANVEKAMSNQGIVIEQVFPTKEADIPIPNLSKAELRVLQAVATGRDNYEVAAFLGLAHSTIRNHMHRVLTKMNVNSRTAAVCLGMYHGLIDIDWVLANMPRRKEFKVSRKDVL